MVTQRTLPKRVLPRRTNIKTTTNTTKTTQQTPSKTYSQQELLNMGFRSTQGQSGQPYRSAVRHNQTLANQLGINVDPNSIKHRQSRVISGTGQITSQQEFQTNILPSRGIITGKKHSKLEEIQTTQRDKIDKYRKDLNEYKKQDLVYQAVKENKKINLKTGTLFPDINIPHDNIKYNAVLPYQFDILRNNAEKVKKVLKKTGQTALIVTKNIIYNPLMGYAYYMIDTSAKAIGQEQQLKEKSQKIADLRAEINKAIQDQNLQNQITYANLEDPLQATPRQKLDAVMISMFGLTAEYGIPYLQKQGRTGRYILNTLGFGMVAWEAYLINEVKKDPTVENIANAIELPIGIALGRTNRAFQLKSLKDKSRKALVDEFGETSIEVKNFDDAYQLLFKDLSRYQQPLGEWSSETTKSLQDMIKDPKQKAQAIVIIDSVLKQGEIKIIGSQGLEANLGNKLEYTGDTDIAYGDPVTARRAYNLLKELGLEVKYSVSDFHGTPKHHITLNGQELINMAEDTIKITESQIDKVMDFTDWTPFLWVKDRNGVSIMNLRDQGRIYFYTSMLTGERPKDLKRVLTILDVYRKNPDLKLKKYWPIKVIADNIVTSTKRLLNDLDFRKREPPNAQLYADPTLYPISKETYPYLYSTSNTLYSYAYPASTPIYTFPAQTTPETPYKQGDPRKPYKPATKTQYYPFPQTPEYPYPIDYPKSYGRSYPTEKTIFKTTTTSSKETRKKKKIQIPTREDDKTAFVPIYKGNNRLTIKGWQYRTKKEAEQTAKAKTDLTPLIAYKLIKEQLQGNKIKKGIPYKQNHKFTQKGKYTTERRYYRKDKPLERQSNFNWMAMVQPKTN